MKNSSKPTTQRQIRRSREGWRALVARFEASGRTRVKAFRTTDVRLHFIDKPAAKLFSAVPSNQALNRSA